MPLYTSLRESVFRNPWGSWQHPSLLDGIRFAAGVILRSTRRRKREMQETLDLIVPQVSPCFAQPSSKSEVRLTWLGHSTVVVQMEGITFITDPHLSDNAGFGGPFSLSRLRPSICSVSDLPKSLDAVLISHNHYDHLDKETVLQLHFRFGEALKWFVPKNVKAWFKNVGIENVQDHDWWDVSHFSSEIRFVFTPAQHWTRRGVTDTNETLWGSWCVLGKQCRFFFAGDTGYCPVFLEIGNKFGPFTACAIPIGAYEPRHLLKRQHINPEEAVRIHNDLRSLFSIGIHWGTFPLGAEDILDPPKKLREAQSKHNVSLGSFVTTKIGEAVLLKPIWQ